LPSSVSEIVERCRLNGQPQLAERLLGLVGEPQMRLAAEIDEIDLPLVGDLVKQFAGGSDTSGTLGDITPTNAVPLPRGPKDVMRNREARERGEGHLQDDKVALVLLAGGQGSRLGFDGPKGNYPFAPLSGRTLFDFFAARIDALRSRYGAALPWYIMTSTVNDAVTRHTFRAANFFGLDPESVRFMVQGMLPAVDTSTGQILLEAPDRLALSPDGHGGLLSTLRRSGALDDMASRGVETIFTFQIDNPLLRIARPEFIGHHVLAGAEMSNLVVRKRSPEEKVGIIAEIGGRTGVIEYSDLPSELAEQRDESGDLTYWAGSIAVHCLERSFVEGLTNGGLSLPFHRALKKVPYLSDAHEMVSPDRQNAIKFETFLFDALPFATTTVSLESAREEEFSPIKNGDGADSPESARVDMNRQYARWLNEVGVAVPTDSAGEPVDLEIDPRFALDADQLRDVLPNGFAITGPTILSRQPPVSA